MDPAAKAGAMTSSALPLVLVRGGGDLGTGVAHRLYMAGFAVAILELPRPRMIRATVCFGSAVYHGERRVEGVLARSVAEPVPGFEGIPVLVDPEGAWIPRLQPAALVDARMLKANRGTRRGQAEVVVGMGPGFTAGEDVDFVVETHRGHDLGRVIASGSALPDTGVPGALGGESARRVVKAPCAGAFHPVREIGDLVARGDLLGRIGETPVPAAIAGMVRGLLQEGLEVRSGEKIADVDPRGADIDVHTISDKSRAVAGGVLEAVMRRLFGSSR